jgi:formate hydrogenlyase subunit 3/multisubunit Na+/H+ antiporter MnhD subunit
MEREAPETTLKNPSTAVAQDSVVYSFKIAVDLVRSELLLFVVLYCCMYVREKNKRRFFGFLSFLLYLSVRKVDVKISRK